MPFGKADADRWEAALRTSGLMASSEKREEAIKEFRLLLEHLRRRAAQSDTDGALYLKAVEMVSTEELTHLDLVTVGRTLRAPISTADSFFASIAARRRKKQLGQVPERHLGISKEFDQLFAELLAVRQPRTEYTGTLDQVPDGVRQGTFLKPIKSSGSKGAFYLYDHDQIRSVQHATTLPSWSEMVSAIDQQLGAAYLTDEQWQVQELVYEADTTPARDLKFYAFYGEIGLVQEVSRHEKPQYEFFDADGTVARCGRAHEPRFADPSQTITDKGGVSAERLETVRHLSREIPAPFMRIDYLNGVDELVFLEMSSAPGMAHTLSDQYDRKLGAMYHEAEIRLSNDLIDGKRFEGFQRFVEQRQRLQSGAPKAVEAAKRGRRWRRRS